jgi:hypothetical protein
MNVDRMCARAYQGACVGERGASMDFVERDLSAQIVTGIRDGMGLMDLVERDLFVKIVQVQRISKY